MCTAERKNVVLVDGQLFEMVPVAGDYVLATPNKKKNSTIMIPEDYRDAVDFFSDMLDLANPTDYIELALERRLKGLPPLCRLPRKSTSKSEGGIPYGFWIGKDLYDRVKARAGKKGAYGEFVAGALFGWYGSDYHEI